jgi:hypothetical protein
VSSKRGGRKTRVCGGGDVEGEKSGAGEESSRGEGCKREKNGEGEERHFAQRKVHSPIAHA